MITETKIQGLNNLKKCSRCLKEVGTIWLEYNDSEKNIFIKQSEGVCKGCLNQLIKLCEELPESKLSIGIIISRGVV